MRVVVFTLTATRGAELIGMVFNASQNTSPSNLTDNAFNGRDRGLRGGADSARGAPGGLPLAERRRNFARRRREGDHESAAAAARPGYPPGQEHSQPIYRSLPAPAREGDRSGVDRSGGRRPSGIERGDG